MLYFNQDKWILKTIENCAPFVDKIYVAWSEKPWNYNENGSVFVNNSNVDFLKQSKYYDKITIIKGEWKLDEDERNSCLNKAKEDGMDYLITQDADEFYTFKDYNKIIDGIRQNPTYDFYTTPWIVFWKNYNYIVTGKDGKQICGYPEIAINLNKDVKFIRCRRPNSTHCKQLDAICHHMCFVFDKDEDCWSKINTWGHSHQFNTTEWYNKYWLNWTPELTNIHPITPSAWHKTLEYKGELPEVLR